MAAKRVEAPAINCAVYTRKSTEEGLEQEFNSLDAQREAGEAFVASQKSEGWVCLPDRYDDGGFTGGNMERPALKRLMADIDAGRVDCVVVYKVDRLSRSLLDFTQIMEALEKRGVSFVSVTQHLQGTKMFISDKCLGLVEALGETFPEAAWQRCTVHFYRNVFTAVPKGKVRQVATMLKAIHAQEAREEAEAKAKQVVAKLKAMKLKKAAGLVEEGVIETLSYYQFPEPHWRRIRTNNPLERIMREIRRRTRVVGAFPDGESALMLTAARLRHIAGTKWGYRTYLNVRLIAEQDAENEQRAG